MIQVQIVGANNRVAEVLPTGQLATAALKYSTGKFNNMDATGTAFNFHEPTAGKRFVITGFIIGTNRDVGPDGAVIEIYEASAVDSIIVDEAILQLDMTKNQLIPILGANIILTEGAFLNGQTDDATVLATIAGYEVDA